MVIIMPTGNPTATPTYASSSYLSVAMAVIKTKAKRTNSAPEMEMNRDEAIAIAPTRIAKRE